ncbi:hypothetical protein T265_02491 [Opisthorchis viverrini]|uniref:Uncharacterized protein n=1 Tax=Opisthorchis viverrini TaxID=6198 RepID=A0A074ZYX7_OPIVI|nr:hypothetical protein T265_02491 [Opisthorchis viverrini]KER31162.1 hypothetical protein T265_02491 [Opisthorchis viverrini]
MPHRPSRGAISRVALLAAYSRAGYQGRLPPEHLPIERAVQPTAALDSTVTPHEVAVALLFVPGAASMLIWNLASSTA